MDLETKLKIAAAKFAAMPKHEQEALLKIQRDNWVKAEMSWPKSKFKMVNGVKVYESYEDYCND